MSNEQTNEREPTPQEQKVAQLKSMLAKVKSTRDIAKLDLSGWDPATRPGMEMAKTQALDTLDHLLAQYRGEIYHNSAAVFVFGTGEECAALEEAAAANGAIVIDASTLYRKIAENVEPKLGPERKLLTDFVMDLEHSMIDACSAFGVNGSFLRIDSRHYDRIVPTFQDLVNIVRDTFRNSAPEYIQPLKDTMAVLAARQQFYGICENTGVAEVPTAVVVSRLTADEVPGFQTHFLPGRPFTTFDAAKTKSPDKALQKAASDLMKKLGL